MRFRFMTMSDIPEAVRLYREMIEEQHPEELPYPLMTEQSFEDFTISIARQLVGNPMWYAITGVVGSTIREDADGNTQVVGGKVKGFMSVSLSQRTVGDPKEIGFVELLVVDKKFRHRDVGRKLAQLCTIEAVRRGIKVIECAWNPNSLGDNIWPRMGFKPYRVLAAFVNDDGTPRHDMPMAKTPPVEAPSEPKRRGRPPKEKPNEPEQ